MINLTNRIPVILDIKGMTQVQLAKKAKINVSHLNRIIKGETPRLDTALRICRALDVSIEKVFLDEQAA